MEALAAIGLTANIIQFVQVSYEFTTRVRQLCHSTSGTTEEFGDLESAVSAALTKISELEHLVDTSAPEKYLITSYIDVSRRLMSILDQIKVKQNAGLFARLRAARRAIARKQKIEQMGSQLDSLVQTIILSLNVEQTRALRSMKDQEASVEQMNTLLKHFLEGPQSRITKALGYPWETGELGEHIRVDDGLGHQYILPLDWCSSQQIFMQSLVFKFKSRNLPGLVQIQNAHLEIWNWEETSKLDKDTWPLQVKGGQGIEVSFVMCSPFGYSRSRCMRCFKEAKANTRQRRYTHCDNCRLHVRWVEPGDISYLPADVSIGLGPDTYANFLEQPDSSLSQNSGVEGAVELKDTKDMPQSQPQDNIPAIDLVCHRLTMKWEPMYNIVHRYMYCRCIARQSTPSKLEREMTIPIFEPCPRHNSTGISFKDYGNQDYHQDPYFDRFGGYNAFRGMVYHVSQEIFVDILGAERFIPSHEIQSTVEAIERAVDADPPGLLNAVEDYQYEINSRLHDFGVQLPDHLEQPVLARQRQETTSEFDSESLERFRQSFADSPATRELNSIITGEWSGRFHWTIE
ncbi:hypothetical protein P170DRAFT_470351 [Aspergillus steynii IBT 23096]|uniref:Ubiquitin-like domain-containing protein n=1 Tax=Aspergillus steynii IBT 23096 TaxID=1392250 RepID=A0A2I2GPW6_9EURO|nr:uncharacterized protein P170DRAFT_470351 [Aspergillus steynii IBT 23096]PLB54916.1 hypothetical protein P170DRAFT_470351 [Aspergillus steynii IBT 23096]